MTTIESMQEFYDIVEQQDKVIIYWYTKWCPDCFMIKPHLPRLEKDFPEYKFYRMNRDKHIDIAKHLAIYGIPSFLVFKDGEEIGRLVNKLRKSYLEVKTFLEQVVR